MSDADNDTKQADGAGRPRFQSLDSFSGSLANRAYLALKAAILNLEYRPGEALRKRDICDLFGISRSPVAEAITRLSREGLVDVVPQAGTYVAKFSIDEIREGAFIREAIELAAVKLLARQITDEQIVQLQRNMRVQQAFVEDGDFPGFYSYDREFHQLILAFTGFRKLTQIAETAWVHVDRARQLILPLPGRVTETLEEHRKIVEALEARDPTAAHDAMKHHLRQLLTFLTPLEKEHPDLFGSG